MKPRRTWKQIPLKRTDLVFFLKFIFVQTSFWGARRGDGQNKMTQVEREVANDYTYSIEKNKPYFHFSEIFPSLEYW